MDPIGDSHGYNQPIRWGCLLLLLGRNPVGGGGGSTGWWGGGGGGLTSRLGAGSQQVDHVEVVADVDEDLQL